jgi:CRISPR-associated protein Cas1
MGEQVFARLLSDELPLTGVLPRIATVGALRQAWQKVDANEGAPGVDRVNLRMYSRELDSNLELLAATLARGWYTPLPTRRATIPKKSGGLRDLAIPTIEDRIVQRALLDLLEPVVEELFLDTSHGYRPGRGVASAVAQCRRAIASGCGWVVDADIEDFFGSVDHERLMARFCELVDDRDIQRLVHAWLTVGCLSGWSVEKTPSGVAQGGPISPMLANLYLHEFDATITGAGFTLVRYADDFVVFCRSKEEAESAFAAVRETLSMIGLSLNEEKTRVASLDQGLEFLGVDLAPHHETRRVSDRVTVLYVTEQGARIHRRGERIVIEKDGGILRDVPSLYLDQIIIFGNVTLTQPAMAHVLTRGIDVTFLSSTGEYYGWLESTESHNPDLILRQLSASMDVPFSLALCSRLVAGKVSNQRRLLQKRVTPDLPRVKEAVHDLGTLARRITTATTLEQLRGLEGFAAKTYFAALSDLVTEEMRFKGRSRRPPADPFNSLLSLGYTLLHHNARSAVRTAGLHPFVGFLHYAHFGRPSLVEDLMEEFRPVVVDLLVLTTVNRRMFQPKDFRPGETAEGRRGIFLDDLARKRFLGAFEERMRTEFVYKRTGVSVTYRKALELQARQLATCIMEDDAHYEPVRIT